MENNNLPSADIVRSLSYPDFFLPFSYRNITLYLSPERRRAPLVSGCQQPIGKLPGFGRRGVLFRPLAQVEPVIGAEHLHATSIIDGGTCGGQDLKT